MSESECLCGHQASDHDVLGLCEIAGCRCLAYRQWDDWDDEDDDEQGPEPLDFTHGDAA